MNVFESLAGKTVNEIYIMDGEEVIVFDTDKGKVAFEGDGDCCSETWFADFTGIEAVLGQTIQSVQELDFRLPPSCIFQTPKEPPICFIGTVATGIMAETQEK